MRWPWVLLPWIAAGADAVALELLGEAAGAVLGAGEDERPIDPTAADQVAEELALAVPVDRE